MSGIDDRADDMLAGHCATLAALIIALDGNGVLPKNKYEDALRRLWLEMPEEAALGDAGAVIERMFELLDVPTVPTGSPDVAVRQPEPWRFAADPVNDDSHAASPWTLLRTPQGTLLPAT